MGEDEDYNGRSQEEPYCYACTDAGCNECDPGRFRLWFWALRYRIAAATQRRRADNDDTFPF